jgi:glutamine synthetase
MIDYSPHMFAGEEKTRKLAISTACLPGIERALVSNFERKCFDGCANPYLALAAIISPGMMVLESFFLFLNLSLTLLHL